MSEQRPDPTRRFFGGLLMAVGGLITVLCGGCSLVFAGGSIVGAIGSSGQLRDLPSWLLLVAVIGGLPTLIGIGLFIWGRRLYRPPKSLRPAQLAVFTDGPEDTP